MYQHIVLFSNQVKITELDRNQPHLTHQYNIETNKANNNKDLK